jgi:hypothetical protein
MTMPKIKPFDLDLGNGEKVRIDSYENIDLDQDPVTLPDGTVLDEAAADRLGREIADRAASRRRGRPSLTAPGEHSPKVSARVTPATKGELIRLADRDGKRPADVVREALEEYIARHA